MPTQKKIDTVADLKERIERATLLASADYRGLRVKEMVEMRRRLREAGLDVRVVKNTLLRLAANESGQPELLEIIEGPTALAVSFGDAIEAAKALAGYAQGAPAGFGLRGGFMDGRVLSAQDLRDLVRVPPKPVLLAQFMGQMQSPLAGFVGLMEAPLRELVGLMQSLLSELPGLVEARARQMQAAGIGVQEPAAEEPAAEEPPAEEPPGEEPATEEVAAETPSEEPVEATVSEEAPVAEAPAEETPDAEEPVEEEPGTEEPAEEPETAKEDSNG
ncbi:MAG: 50S ribosomal protein L10 [Chloroflexi bacterium]|nr:MAG: 50S ribosomal protein L10 [Chloroflexota bacterium]